MKKLLKIIDSVSEWGGRATSWFAVALILVMTTEVIMRYVFDSPTLWAYETAIMLGVTVYVIGWAYAQVHQKHIRVDVFYARLSHRGKAFVDVFGWFFLAFPMLTIMTINSIQFAVIAWITKERMTFSIWYPPAGPLRTVIAFGFVLLTLQCLAQFFRDVYAALRSKAYD